MIGQHHEGGPVDRERSRKESSSSRPGRYRWGPTGAIPLWVCLSIILGGCGDRDTPQPGLSPEASADTPHGPTTRRLVFSAAPDLSFDAVLEFPEASRRNGWGVLMIGGGMGNTLDWDLPGVVVHEGQTMQLTVTGQPHADAPALSRALTRRGFAVMRWSTIARDDPFADDWPVRATPRTQGDLLAQARAALGELRASGLGGEGRVLLLGHSQGALRAVNLVESDRSIGGLVLLAPAYFMRDGRVADLLASEGLRFGEDVLRTHPLPTLALFGGRDSSRAVDAAGVSSLADSGIVAGLRAEVFSDLGHQLGPQEGHRHGPIDAGVVELLAGWCEEIARVP